MKHQYLKPRLTPNNLDRFVIRSAILKALQETLPLLSGRLLDVGCGHMPYRSLVLAPPSRVDTYIGLDIASDIYQGRDAEWDGSILPFADDSVGSAMATEVLEHCASPAVILSEIQRVLRPGGVLFFTTPFLWPLHDVPYDEYRYTPFALERHLRNSGFTQIELRALGGWDASLGQMLGLWVRRRPMPRGIRFVMSAVALSLVRLLNKSDQLPVTFGNNTMVTGIWGTALKPTSVRSISS